MITDKYNMYKWTEIGKLTEIHEKLVDSLHYSFIISLIGTILPILCALYVLSV